MRIRIDAPGIFGKNGEIPVGTEFDVQEEPKAWAGRYTIISGVGGATPVTNPEQGAIPRYEAVHRGAGHYSIMLGDKEVAKGLSKEDAEAFNALKAEEKAELVKSYEQAE